MLIRCRFIFFGCKNHFLLLTYDPIFDEIAKKEPPIAGWLLGARK
jgi:hypothetical protein